MSSDRAGEAEGAKLGRPSSVEPAVEATIRRLYAKGTTLRAIAAEAKVSVTVVQRVPCYAAKVA